MKIPMTWLNEYVDIKDVPLNDFMDAMTMVGQKVEGAERTAQEIENVIAGKLLSIRKHPSAERLVIADVDVGKSETLSIITGATNVKENDIVPIAMDGATLANGVKIKNGEIRGERSQGMMCAIDELGFTIHDFPEAPEDGIYIFPEHMHVQPGSDVCDILDLRQDVVEYEITSNRPDCFSVIGIAREAAAAYRTPLKMPEATPKELAGGNAEEMVKIEIKNAELCPRYAARIVKNVKIEPSPQWLRRRLTSAGVRPINNIVDITNYVMLEMGQPMHAFDLSEVEGGIVVKNAQDGERFTTLDGTERTLDSSMLVIADHKKTLAIAGVMGGENSKITGGAGAVLFESACFNGTNIRLTSKKLGLRTDASGKYEKGIDPNLAYAAVNRAAYLVELLGAGEVVCGVADCYPNKREIRSIPFEPQKINKLLGTEIPEDEMAKLISLFEIEINGDTATIPTFRPDIEGMADLAEEAARAYGYDKIEPKMVTGTPTAGKKTYEQGLLDIIKETAVSLGFYEAMTYSFEGPAVFDKLLVPESSELRNAIKILNPLGESYSIMRTTPINSMLESLSTNYNKRNMSARLFETANIYIPKSLPVTELPEEKNIFIAGMYGEGCDFYSAKGCAETLFENLGIENYDFLPAKEISWLHPGRAAKIFVNNCEMGYVGEVHPLCLENYSIGKRVYIISMEIQKLYEAAVIVRKFKELPKYPPAERDIAFLVSDAIMVSELKKAIAEYGGKLLAEITLFDVYKGEQVGEGQKSVAFSLVFRSQQKTLSDNDVNPLMENIVKCLEEKFGAKLRV